jgi:hypothetical protein
MWDPASQWGNGVGRVLAWAKLAKQVALAMHVTNHSGCICDMTCNMKKIFQKMLLKVQILWKAKIGADFVPKQKPRPRPHLGTYSPGLLTD